MKNITSILAISAVAFLTSCGEEVTTQQAVKEENPKVTVEKVHAEYVSQLSTYPTTVEADIVNNIAPQSASRINAIYVEVGDHVKKGQTLAVMDEVNLEKSHLQMVNDSINYGRIKELHEIGAASQSDYESMTLAYDVSKRTYKNLLENTILKSPSSGIVTARNYDKGDMYAMAMPLFVIQDITPVKMLINISESNYSKIEKGMEVDIVADAYQGEVFKGKVNIIYPAIDAMTHTFPVEIVVENNNERLRPGMFVRVTVNYGDNYRVVVPDRAVMKQVGSGEQYVYVMHNDHTVTYSVVETGRRMGDKYEIISGVDDGATVITSGQSKLRNGITVDVK